ncbi:hypothetical protein HOY80DRAFT_995691 [Tuber brumale]|nr:hypothetical protein HOY80DRAFT_995691 [Tuber brumale]
MISSPERDGLGTGGYSILVFSGCWGILVTVRWILRLWSVVEWRLLVSPVSTGFGPLIDFALCHAVLCYCLFR